MHICIVLKVRMRLKEFKIYKQCQMEMKERVKATWAAEQHLPTRTVCRLCVIIFKNQIYARRLFHRHQVMQPYKMYVTTDSQLTIYPILGWQVWAGFQTLNNFPRSN